MKIALFLLALLSTDVSGWRLGGQSAVDSLHASGAPAALLDRVCAQKDCRTSRLFWHTDLAEAQETARRLGRPILSLHLLGRLDEELSCANSRFFRVMLYSDPAISAILREKYVLHWHSVRPVPQVTIEMGDGRTIRQTITGNSVHYLLDANGNVLDALPGLHSPRAFREQLEEWLQLDAEQARAYHAARAHRSGLPTGSRRPIAVDAAMYAASKVNIERPLLQQLTLATRVPEVRFRSDEEVVFSEESLALMRKKQPLTAELMENLRRSIATDMQLNREMHGVIHRWFADGEVRDLASLNERIYAELFLTPSSDPWLGLNPEAMFAAIGQ